MRTDPIATRPPEALSAPSGVGISSGGASVPALIPSTGFASPTRQEQSQDDGKTLQSQLDEVLSAAQTSLDFRVDEATQQVVVSVYDRNTGDLVCQIPSEVALRIARQLAREGRGLIDESA